MDPAPSHNRKCEVIPNSRFRFFTANKLPGPTGHEEAAVNVAEGLRAECGHGLVIVHSATAIQNLQLAVCNGKADLGAILVGDSGGHFRDCSAEAATRHVGV